jgi:hypothetical protein
MNSVIFRDTRVDLHSHQLPPGNQTYADLHDRPQTAITALPQPSSHISSTAHSFSTAGIASTSNAANSAKLVKTSRIKKSRKAAKSEKATKASQKPPSSKNHTWGGRLFSTIKGVFPWRKRKDSSVGEPYNFQHIETAGIYPLRGPVPLRHPVQVRDPMPSRQPVPYGGLVSVSARTPKDTVFEQGEIDSEWEDIEETTVSHRE